MYTPPPSPPRPTSTKYRRDRDHDPIPIYRHPSSSTDLIFSMSPSENHFFPPPPNEEPPLSVLTRARQLQNLQPRRQYTHIPTLYSFPTPGLLKSKMIQERRSAAPQRSIPVSGHWYEQDEEEPDAPILARTPPSPSTTLTATFDIDHFAFPIAEDPHHPSSKHRRHSLKKSPFPPHPLMLKDPARTPLRPDVTNPHKSRTGPIKIVGFDAALDDEERGRRRKWR